MLIRIGRMIAPVKGLRISSGWLHIVTVLISSWWVVLLCWMVDKVRHVSFRYPKQLALASGILFGAHNTKAFFTTIHRRLRTDTKNTEIKTAY